MSDIFLTKWERALFVLWIIVGIGLSIGVDRRITDSIGNNDHVSLAGAIFFNAIMYFVLSVLISAIVCLLILLIKWILKGE